MTRSELPPLSSSERAVLHRTFNSLWNAGPQCHEGISWQHFPRPPNLARWEACADSLLLSYSYESFKKAELELALDEFLAENSTQFIADPKFAPYYSSRNRAAGSPIKRDLDDKPRVSKRRLTKAIEEAPTLPAPAPE